MSERPTLTEQVRQGPLLAGLTADEIQRLLAHCTLQIFAPGEALMNQGEEGSDLFLLLEGSAKALRDGRNFASHQAGEAVGELGLLDPAPRAASVIANDRVQAFRLERKVLLSLLAQQDDVAIKTVRALTAIACQRLQRVNQLVQDEIIGPQKQGLFQSLWRKVTGQGH